MDPSSYCSYWFAALFHESVLSSYLISKLKVRLEFKGLSRTSLHSPACCCRRTVSRGSNMFPDFLESLLQQLGISSTFLMFVKLQREDPASVTTFTDHNCCFWSIDNLATSQSRLTDQLEYSRSYQLLLGHHTRFYVIDCFTPVLGRGHGLKLFRLY